MNKRSTPYLIGVPNISIGLLWGMNLVLIPMLAATITQSNAELGTLVSMGAFTGIFVQYFAGILSDRSRFKMGKRKPFILIGILTAAVFICMMPYAKTYWMLFVIAFCFYFSLNFFQGPYYSLIPEAVDEKQLGLANGFSKILSILGSGVILIAGPILWNIDSKLPFFLAASIALISVVSTLFFIQEKPGVGKAKEKLAFDFVKFPSVMKLYVSVFFIFMSYGCITPFFVKYCTTVLHFPQSTASNGLLLLTLAGALFAYPIGILSDKIERRKVLLLGAIIFALALFVATFVKTTLLMYGVLAVIGIGFIAVQITIYPILSEIAPPERLGEFMGFMNLFISLGQFISNNLMGYVLDRAGFTWFFPTAAALMLMAGLVVGLSRFEKYKNDNYPSEEVDA